MNICGWFEIPVTDINRAIKFYESSFDIKLKPMETGTHKLAGFPYNEKEGGATGALITGEGYKPSHDGTMVYFSVSDIDESLKKIESRGGKTLLPKKSIGEYGFFACFEDSEGNRVALHSMK